MRALLAVLSLTGGVAVSLPGAFALPVNHVITQTPTATGATIEQVRWLCYPYYGCRWVWTPSYFVYGWHPYYRPNYGPVGRDWTNPSVSTRTRTTTLGTY
jgi:hypothetical protein